MNPLKRLLLFATKLGYQTRSFNAAAEKLGVSLLLLPIAAGGWTIPGTTARLPRILNRRKPRREPSGKRNEDFVSTVYWP